MSDLFWLSGKQFSRMRPYFPLAYGGRHTDDRWVIFRLVHATKIVDRDLWRIQTVDLLAALPLTLLEDPVGLIQRLPEDRLNSSSPEIWREMSLIVRPR